MRTLRIVLVLALASSAAFGSPSAPRGGPGTWTLVAKRVTALGEVALARGRDGALHVVWAQDDGATESIRHRVLGADGRFAGPPGSIVTGWRSLNVQPALAVAADGRLHAVFAGLHSTKTGDPLNAALHTAEATTDRRWSSPVQASQSNRWGYAASGFGAAVTPEGQLVVAQGDSCPRCNFYRFLGTAPASPDVAFESRCCVRNPEVVVDGRTGEVLLGWNWTPSGSTPGLYAQRITRARTLPPRLRAPDSTLGAFADWGITGRIGASGVFAAYLTGSGTEIKLWRAGSRRATVVAQGKVLDASGIAPAPDGRLWVFWESGGRYAATRSNRAATRFGPVVAVARPRSALPSTIRLSGEGTRGPLDLVAHLDTSSASEIWHTQVLPRLSLACAENGPVVCRVSDAGDPVRGARVRIRERTLVTNAQGEASASLPSGDYQAVASKAGYAPAVDDVTIP